MTDITEEPDYALRLLSELTPGELVAAWNNLSSSLLHVLTNYGCTLKGAPENYNKRIGRFLDTCPCPQSPDSSKHLFKYLLTVSQNDPDIHDYLEKMLLTAKAKAL